MVTLENPVEYRYSEDSLFRPEQREIGTDLPSYAAGIETLMTSSPNIAIVQELTTNDVIRSAMELAKKGVLVIGSLHCPDATSIFGNIADAYTAGERK